MALRVLRVQQGATFQDLGRPGFRRFGVPPGGAFDAAALRWGNSLLENPPWAPCLELMLTGGLFEAEEDLWMAVVGAPCPVRANGVATETGRPFLLPSGGTLELGLATEGLRILLCVRGGFDGPRILGSVSGHAVRPGDRLPIGREKGGPFEVEPPRWKERRQVPIHPGPSAELLPESSLSRPFEVSPQSSRMGVRLEGLEAQPIPELPSEPCDVGTVQRTPGGQLLVLGPDGPTVGGYPKVGFIPTEHLWKLGQLRPGETVRLLPAGPWS
ncbi:MAG: biotin-dependent carboxyltransferase family protein [Fimbriimonadales bacterium]|nr:biotin-dependent carboxyltransferase family protein [Fimbriimonadales bacterium]